MKKAIISAALLAAGLFSGCSSEESVSKPETVGQTGTLTFSFPAPRQSITYAIDDATESESAVTATAGEIKINDVTVYMFKNSGDSDGELLVARKTASADEASARSVKFDVNDFATGSDNYLFYAVANVNGNITDNFVVGQTTLDEFTTAVTTDTGTEPIPGSNMLMAGYVTIEGLSTATSPVQTINLRHRVARFDIDNLTADDDPANDNMEPGSGGNAAETFFEITKIHVINTLSKGYLTKEDNTDTRPDLTDKVSLKGDNAIDVSKIPGINELPVAGAFYLWPGKLADKSHYKDEGSAAIEVEGVYTGDGDAKVFTVLLESEKDIEANKRYTLKVQRISQTTLTFSLIPSGWGDGDEVTAKPATDGSFIYGGFELLAGGAVNSAPVANNTVDLSANTGEYDNELRFYTESESNGTGALTATLAMTLGTGYSTAVTPVPDGAPVVTYSIGKVRQYYKIILPKTTYPVSGTLTIREEKTELYKELAVTSVPKYENTDYEPVQVEGQYSEGGPGDERKYWAPVNVGATSTTYSTGSPSASCGHYFQWGRNVPFSYGSTGDTYNGPVTTEIDPADYANKFIINTTAPNDWLDPKDDNLWSGDKAQGPCPAGWRIPTGAELTVLKGKIGSVTNNRVKVTGINGDLYLTAAGGRDGLNSAGPWNSRGETGYYWSSTVSEFQAIRFRFGGGNPLVVDPLPRTTGLSVRCIQD
ncbi:MAG: FimB/Mfa2 family fimbrial subunit [Prevotella sp.]|jgi:hypothetical protein|nr:FimB/Mfa2 family fimbrial subunit [Prevotella sp.]